jgi:hypothetical protein
MREQYAGSASGDDEKSSFSQDEADDPYPAGPEGCPDTEFLRPLE